MSDTYVAPVLGPEELSEMLAIRSDVRILDVRTPSEFESAHIPGAYNVPLDTLSEHTPEIMAVKEPVVLVCQSGRRAAQAEVTLRNTGLPNLHLLDGGLNAWILDGQAVRAGRKKVSLERQVRILAGGLAAIGGVLAVTVSAWFAILPVFIGSGLVYSGITDKCGMAMILGKLPYNHRANCDIEAIARALRDGLPAPVPANTGASSATTAVS